MENQIEINHPFGPCILETYCPEEIIDELNNYTEEVSRDPLLKSYFSSKDNNIPNLLLRDFESIFIPKDFCDDIGFTEFVEKISQFYVKEFTKQDSQVELSVIDYDPSFSLRDKILYADAWINRYFSGDFTPSHNHGGDISGVIFLKLSEDLKKEQNENRYSSGDFPFVENNEHLYEEEELPRRMNGNLQFFYGSTNKYSYGTYNPIQKEGKVILFPSWLEHFVYPQKTNSERRTISFNIRVL